MHTHNAPGARAAQREQTGPAASVTENAAQVKEAAAQAGDGPGACAAEAEGAASARPEEKRAPGAQEAGARAGDGPKTCAAEAEGAAGARPEEKRAPGTQAAGGRVQPAQAPGGVQQRQAGARAQVAGAQAGDGPKTCTAEVEGAAGATPEEKRAPGAQVAGARAGDGPKTCAAEVEGAAGAMPEEKRAPGTQAAGGQAAPMPAEGAQVAGASGCGRAKLWPLFLATLYISTFTFGGGFVIVTFMKRKFVDSLKWLSEEEMLDFAALAQASPGAIAVNAAILVGSRTIGYAPPDGLGKGLNIPPRQLMRDKLQYSIEGICCQLDIPLRYVPLAVVVARVRAYCAMGSS